MGGESGVTGAESGECWLSPGSSPAPVRNSVTLFRRTVRMNSDFEFLRGPLRNDETKEDVRPRRRAKARRRIDHERFRSELVEHFEHRLSRLRVVKTTTTPRGQTIDWIPIAS